MKKNLIRFMVVVLLFTLHPLITPARGKKINVFGSIGLAASEMEGIFLDAGAEMQFTDYIYGRLSFDYYFNHTGLSTPGFSDKAYGINLYGVYKFPAYGNWTIFSQGGITYTWFKLSGNMDFLFLGYDAPFGYSISESYFGFGGGVGLEYSLSEKLSIQTGATAKLLLDGGVHLTWFKFYAGVLYTVN